MSTAALVIATVSTVVTAVAMFALFVWAAKKDGEDEARFRRTRKPRHR